MKKLLLLAAAALTVVACKKDSDEPTPTPDGGGNQKPVEVPAGFVKSIQEVSTDGTRTKTTTYNVENNVLKGWTEVISNGDIYTHTLEYKGAQLSTYTSAENSASRGNIVTKFNFLYENNKLTKIEKVRDGKKDVFNITVDDQNRITSKHLVLNPTDGWDAGNTWTATFTYSGNTLVVKDPVYGSTYTYTYEDGNVVRVEDSYRNNSVLTYDKTLVNDLNFEYFRWIYIAQLFVRHSDITLGNNDIFVRTSKNFLTSNGVRHYEVIEKQGNKPKKVNRKYGTNPDATIFYTY